MARKPTEKPVTPRSNKTVTPKHNTTVNGKYRTDSKYTIGQPIRLGGGITQQKFITSDFKEEFTRFGVTVGGKTEWVSSYDQASSLKAAVAATPKPVSKVTPSTRVVPKGGEISTKILPDRIGKYQVHESKIKDASGKVIEKFYRIGKTEGGLFKPLGEGSSPEEAIKQHKKTIKEANAKVDKKIQSNPDAPESQKQDRKNISKQVATKESAKKSAASATKKAERATGKSSRGTSNASRGAQKTVEAAKKASAAVKAKRSTRGKGGVRREVLLPNQRLAKSQYLDASGRVRSTSIARATPHRRKTISIAKKSKITPVEAAKQYWEARQAAKEAKSAKLAAKREKAIARAKKDRLKAREKSRKIRDDARKAWRAAIREIRQEQYAYNRTMRDARRSVATTARRSAQRATAKKVAAQRAPALKAAAIQNASAVLATKPQLISDYLKNAGLSKMESKAVRTGVPHALRYPAMNHASAKPFMKQLPLTGPVTLQPLASEMQAIPQGTLYKTSDVLHAPSKFTDPAGVAMRVDISEVLHVYRRALPEGIHASFSRSKSEITRRLMDIIEPYVPKDTGALYTSAEDLSDAAGLGAVTEEGGGKISGGVIAYRQPYAEIVYFDLGGHKRHGAEYNAHYGTSEKGEKETAKWIEVALQNEGEQIDDLIRFVGKNVEDDIRAALAPLGRTLVAFTPRSGRDAGQLVAFSRPMR